MMIEVEGLGKSYRLGGQQAVYRNFREEIVRLVTRSFRRRSDRANGTFWALRDVSFSVPEGEVVGVIGRNGAGKSTLLKLLSRITRPTEGRAKLYGRVGSLLEVGTGFHPELSGRENMFLNGTVLGMRRAEVARKFDEIVEFSEIGKFLDTPVKHYSSGMYVRLAFAVAAHLDPEILLVDEVLAVGDAAFQKKCLGKMTEVARGGRTVLFVSHGMDSVRRLCERVIWLDEGKTRRIGEAQTVVSDYLTQHLHEGGRVDFDPPLQLANGIPLGLVTAQLSREDGTVQRRYSARDPIRVEVEWLLTERLYKPRIGFVLLTAEGVEMFTAIDAVSWGPEWLEPGRYRSCCTLPGQLLNEGRYVLDFSADAPRRHNWTPGRTGALIGFEIEDDMTLPNKYYGQEGFRDARWPGVLLPDIPWTQERVD